MDSRLVNAKADDFKDRTIRLTPEIFDQIGLVKKNTSLRVEEFRISCIPFDLSLLRTSLLAFLSEREVEFFKEMADKPQKLLFSWQSPYSVKPIDFFLLCKVSAFRKSDPASPYCFIDVDFAQGSIPLAFKELIVSYFLEHDEAKSFYSDAPDEPLSDEQVEKALGCRHLSMSRENGSAERLKILALTPRSLKVFGEFEGTHPTVGESVELESCRGNETSYLEGKCTAFVPSEEAPGFARMELSLEFTPATSSKIKKAVNWAAKKTQP